MLAKQTRYEEALSAYQNALELDPSNELLHIDTGNVFFDLGEYAAAEASYLEATRLRPDYAFGYAFLDSVLSQQNRYEEAIAAYRQAVALDPGNPAFKGALLKAHC